MFLNESVEGTGIVSNETSMYEAILEANNAYHSLCMQAVKYEHQAIVSEDAQLLREAEEGFMTKLKNIAKTLYQKFISFINRVKAEWSKLYASVITKLGYNSGATLQALKKHGDTLVDISVNVTDCDKVSKRINDLMEKCAGRLNVHANEFMNSGGQSGAAAGKMFGDLVAYLKDLDKFFGKDKNFARKKRKVSRAEIDSAIDFLQERPKYIKLLEGIRSAGAEAYKLTVTAIDNETLKSTEGMLIAKFTTIINKIITRVNNFTTDCVRIARAVANIKGPKNKEMEKFDKTVKRAVYK